MNKLSHEEYVNQQREKVASIANLVITKKLNILEAAKEISSISNELGLDENDEDINILRAINSETDSLPIGKEKDLWSKNALLKKQNEIEKAEKWAIEIGFNAFSNLVNRFGDNIKDK